MAATSISDAGGGEGRRPNRLALEKSPYLLQHQYNPVDWYAWGDEAFAKARAENKPIFLSIGYSTCHWCHVMERESFEDEAIARKLNKYFVSIKMDREERPDVDRIYMTFVQATTGQGGWPLNVFLTPGLKPFFGGTYFPPGQRQGRPGFGDLLEQVAETWTTRHDEILVSADEMQARLQELFASAPARTGKLFGVEVLQNAATALKGSYDREHGGFGNAPKFPQPSQPQFLLRCAARFGDSEAMAMVLETCDRMAAGGIHDQLGGGFARYAVDAQWLVPHFEKMLYDNAQLAQLYLDAFLASGHARYAATARDIFDYVLRDMTHPLGGFYSAEDADSEGYEGKFYCWTRQELAALLTRDELEVAADYFGITEAGNFLDHSHPRPLTAQNVLSIVGALPDGDRLLLLDSARRKMLEARNRRVRPHLDDKVLVSWNGLMLGALARGGAILGEERYRSAAEKNLGFLKGELWRPAQGGAVGTLYHRWRDGHHDAAQLLSGYAFLLAGVLDLYEATLEPAHLEFAIQLAESLLARFYDSERGGFWQSTPDATDLVLTLKEDYDGAEPSGGSVATLALFRLGHISGRRDFLAAAGKTLQFYGERLRGFPQAVPFLLQAVDFSLQEPRRVVVAGDPAGKDSAALLRAVQSVYQPNKIVLGNLGPVEPFARTLSATNGSEVFICTGTSCQLPTSDSSRIRELLLS